MILYKEENYQGIDEGGYLMEKLVDKLDSYNILNNLLPGIVLNFLFERICNIKIVDGNIMEDLFIFYFVGMIVSRVGSLIIEPICKKINWVKFADYRSFVRTGRKDEKINVLSEINNLYRTIFSACVIVWIGKLYLILITGINLPSTVTGIILLAIVTILFAFAYKKQTKYVADRVKNVKEQEEI